MNVPPGNRVVNLLFIRYRSLVNFVTYNTVIKFQNLENIISNTMTYGKQSSFLKICMCVCCCCCCCFNEIYASGILYPKLLLRNMKIETEIIKKKQLNKITLILKNSFH